MTIISKSCVRQNIWQIERPCRQETWRQHEVCQSISFTKPEAETATKSSNSKEYAFQSYTNAV